MYTLRELCEILNLSRRTVQGYEKIGLVQATSKNVYGHLLYSDEAKNRIEIIRFYQIIGFSHRDIARIIDAPKAIVKQELISKAKEMRERKENLEELIIQTDNLIDSL